MGRDLTEVRASFSDGAEDVGRLQWEPPRLLFRGTQRRVFEGRALAGTCVDGDDLRLADGTRFRLGGAQAARWAAAILDPPSRLDKLGVKPGLRVGVNNLGDPAFLAELETRTPVIQAESALDILFHGADSLAELAEIPALIPRLADRGALWIVSRKGKAAGVKDVDVFAAARPAGLTDTKVCAFSDTHTALRFVRRR